MDKTESSSPVANDVLHNEEHSKLTPEEIAKAVAHHNRHHGGVGQQNTPAKSDPGKNKGAAKRQ